MATKQAIHRQTRTFSMKPQEIPTNYIDQIAALLSKYLNFEMAPDALIPYFSRAYSQFYLLTSADGQRVHGCGGINVLDIGNERMIYLGAVVVETGFRGISTLYQPIFRDVLRHRLARPQRASHLFGAIVSPYAYAAMAKRFTGLMPAPAQPRLDDEVLGLAIDGLTELYGQGLQFDRERGLVRPRVSLSAVAERPLKRGNAAIDFYLERNPAYQTGMGLIFAVPLTLGMFVDTWRSMRLGVR